MPICKTNRIGDGAIPGSVGPRVDCGVSIYAIRVMGDWNCNAQLNFTVLLILVPFTISYGFVLLFSILQSQKAKA